MQDSLGDQLNEGTEDVREWVDAMAAKFVKLSREQVDPPLRAFVLTFGGVGKLAQTGVGGASELMASLKKIWDNEISDETKARMESGKDEPS